MYTLKEVTAGRQRHYSLAASAASWCLPRTIRVAVGRAATTRAATPSIVF